MEPLPAEFYVHDIVITPIAVTQGRAGGDNPTLGTPRSAVPGKFQQSARNQGFNSREGDPFGQGGIIDRTDATLRFPTNPNVEHDYRADIYTRPDDNSNPVLIRSVNIAGEAYPLRFDDVTGQPGSWAVDVFIIN